MGISVFVAAIGDRGSWDADRLHRSRLQFTRMAI